MFLYFFFRGLVSANMADAHKALSHILDLFTGEAQGTDCLAVRSCRCRVVSQRCPIDQIALMANSVAECAVCSTRKLGCKSLR
jgi:hypothetical protein